MSKAEYVPAQSEQLSYIYLKNNKFGNYDLKYFTNGSHFKHNCLLQSCYYGLYGILRGRDFRKSIGIPNDITVYGDSGGFQIASFKRDGKVCKLNPIDSLRWQEANCNVGMNLDVPPNLNGNPTEKEFNEALIESVKNFELFERKRKNYDMTLLNVLHGESLIKLEAWYNAVKHFKFDGYAIGVKPAHDPMLQALGFVFLWEKGEYNKPTFKHLHFFGTSGINVCPTIVYCANKLNGIKVSYDSSSYDIGNRYRRFDINSSRDLQIYLGDRFEKENPKISSIPCKCPVCSSIPNFEYIRHGQYASSLMSLHNMYNYINYNATLNAIVKQNILFIKYLEIININEKTLVSLEFIDYAINHGVKNAYKIYRQYFKPDCNFYWEPINSL